MAGITNSGNRPLKSRTVGALLLTVGLFFMMACGQEKAEPSDLNQTLVLEPGHFPKLDLDTGQVPTAKRIALGKRLFFDPILSRDNSISCSSCHLPEKAFTDGRKVAKGIESRQHKRNSPTLFNVAWQPYLFMDGGNPSLESQVIGPIEDHREMDLPFTEAMAKVAARADYQAQFQEAFASDVNPYTLSRALAIYERALVSANSAFDRYEYGSESSALSAAQIRGLELFRSDQLKCAQCHQLPLSTNFKFENNGLKKVYQDSGRARVTNDLENDEGKFKVASLRNIELTAPYMHDGSLEDLDAVIEHYASGGEGHRLQSPLVAGFNISAQQKADLIAFLRALTDTVSYKEFTD